ncbi:MAG: Pr6Pr family membrane protein [Sphingobacteriales bacterium]|nr:Pr6Pr family membrane protein [Sphingobacteriales bacterium]
MLYPVIYVTFILIRGCFSDFYPYPFVDAGNPGLSKIIINSMVLMLLFIILSLLFIRVGRAVKSR